MPDNYRQNLRIEADQVVCITDLDNSVQLGGRIADISPTGLRLMLDRKVAPGASVKVEWGKVLILGEIIYCFPHDRGFVAGLEIMHRMNDKEAFRSWNREVSETAAENRSSDAESSGGRSGLAHTKS
jgi:hypothetical protein